MNSSANSSPTTSQAGSTAQSGSTALKGDWNLEALFSGPEEPDFERNVEQLEADLGRALETFPSHADLDAKTVLAIEEISARFRHASAYLSCVIAANTNDESAHRQRARLTRLGAELEKLSTKLELALAKLEDASFAALLESPDLAPVAYFLDRSRTKARYRMAPALEELCTELQVSGFSSWGRMRERIAGRLELEYRVDEGSGVQAHKVPMSRMRSLMQSPNRSVRKAVLEGSNAAWASVADPLAAALNAICGQRITVDAHRAVAHYLDPALFDAGIERATLEALLTAVRERQPLMHAWLGRKAKMLGLERLESWDLTAPLPLTDGEVSKRLDWAEGRARVQDAFAPYPALAQLAEQAFNEDWIDHSPRSGKAQGAFCSSPPLLQGSRVFMTFDGAEGDVRTLAHELGHAFHGHVMRDMRPWARRYPMTLAESASTFGETLAVESALQAASSDSARQAILARRLDDAALYLCAIPMRYDIECALFERRKEAELSVEELCEICVQAQRSNYGDALSPDSEQRWTWASTLHFFLTGIRFYNFPYTFGFLFSTALSALAREHRQAGKQDEFFTRYEALLRDTGSLSAEDLARTHLGQDLRDPHFWHTAIDEVERELEAF